MFKRIKRFFSKIKTKKRDEYQTAGTVTFKDLKGTKTILEIRSNGNNTMLLLRDGEDKVEFAFDPEITSILTVLLQSYLLHGIFPDLTDTKEGEFYE